jgi:hypothetical protein
MLFTSSNDQFPFPSLHRIMHRGGRGDAPWWKEKQSEIYVISMCIYRG